MVFCVLRISHLLYGKQQVVLWNYLLRTIIQHISSFREIWFSYLFQKYYTWYHFITKIKNWNFKNLSLSLFFIFFVLVMTSASIDIKILVDFPCWKLIPPKSTYNVNRDLHNVRQLWFFVCSLAFHWNAV